MSDPSVNSTRKGENIRFEETLSIDDEEGAKGLIKYTRIFGGILIVITLVSGFFVVRDMTGMVGGVDVALSIVNGIRAERPLVFAGLVLLALLIVAYLVFLIGGFIFQLRHAFDEEVHTIVTDTSVRVNRKGGSFGQSSGVQIPVDAVTAVEYLDPDNSSTRLDFDDVRSKQFFAGRSTDWVRIERVDDPAVYIGSDRSKKLAETIVRSAPAVENAQPF